jgi:hypothetical protein
MHKDTMQGMFNTDQSKGEQMQNKLLEQLEDNKKRYDR